MITLIFRADAIPKTTTREQWREIYRWKRLQRYTHVRQKGDKYAGWPWLEAATTPMRNPKITAKGSLPRSLRSTRYAAASK